MRQMILPTLAGASPAMPSAVHLVGHIDATEPTIEPWATADISQLECIKQEAGDRFTADVIINRQAVEPRKKIAEGLTATAVMAAPLVVGLAVGVSLVRGGSWPWLLAGAAFAAGGLAASYTLAQQGLWQEGPQRVKFAREQRKFPEPIWSGQRVYQIGPYRMPLISSKLVAAGKLGDKKDTGYLSEFLASRMKAYPSGTTVIYGVGHGLGYRYSAGLPFPVMRESLRVATEKSGRAADLLLLESCQQANLEALAGLQPYARYALVSEEDLNISSGSVMLREAIKDAGNGSLDAETLGRGMVAHACNRAETLMLVDMQKIPQLRSATDKLGTLLAEEAGSGRQNCLRDIVKGTARYPRGFFKTDLRDRMALGDLRQLACRASDVYGGRSISVPLLSFGSLQLSRRRTYADASASPRAAEVVEAASKVLDALAEVSVAQYRSDDYADCGGISVQLPSRRLARIESSKRFREYGLGRFDDSEAPQGWKKFVAALSPQV